MNSAVGPIWMKVLLKKEVCGSCEQYTRLTKQCIITWNALLKKKRRKENAKTQTLAAVSKQVLILLPKKINKLTCRELKGMDYGLY